MPISPYGAPMQGFDPLDPLGLRMRTPEGFLGSPLAQVPGARPPGQPPAPLPGVGALPMGFFGNPAQPPMMVPDGSPQMAPGVPFRPAMPMGYDPGGEAAVRPEDLRGPTPAMPDGPAVPLTGPQAAGISPPGGAPTTLAAAADQAPTAAPRTPSNVPPAIYDLIKREAEARGVPLPYALALFQIESGFDPNAVNPRSGAGGLGQLLASTAQQPGYGMTGISPDDRFTPEKAVPFSLDYLLARGKSIYGDSFDPKNPQHLQAAARAYGENTDDYVKKFATAAGMEFKPGEMQALSAKAGGSPTDGGADGTPGGRPQSPDYQALFGNIPNQMNQTNVMLALASGLLQGPNFGEGLGKGVERVLGLSSQDGQAAQQTARLIAQAKINEPLRQLQYDRLNETKTRTKIMEVQALMRGQSLTQSGERLAQGWAAQGLTAQQIALKLQQHQDAINPDVQRDVSGAKEGGKLAERYAEQRQQQTLDGAPARVQTIHEIDTAMDLINKGTPQGGTLGTRINQALTDLGFTGNANDLGALDKIYTGIRNASISDLTGGHVGGIRSNAELRNLSGALADRSTNPEAAKWILQLHRRSAVRELAWKDHMMQAMETNPEALSGRNFKITEKKFYDDWDAKNPMPDYVRPQDAANPAPGARPPAPTSGEIDGVTWRVVPR